VIHLKFSYKIHKKDDEIILAICDSSLLGKNLEDDEMNFHVSEEFYSQDTCDDAHIKELIGTATILNVIGNDIINIMIDEKLVQEDKIMKIAGVPHAQIIKV